jgi:hypothetical protein
MYSHYISRNEVEGKEILRLSRVDLVGGMLIIIVVLGDPKKIH